MEVDGAVVLRGMAPAHLHAGPARALHGTRRQVDGLAVHRVGAGVDDAFGRHLAGEVPGGDGRLAGAGSFARGAERRFRAERPRQHSRCFELAVVVVGRGRARACRQQEIAAPGAASAKPGRGGDNAGVVHHHRRRQRLLAHRKLALVRVVAEEDPVPGAGAQCLADACAARPGAVACGGGEGAFFVDLEGEARAGGGIDSRHEGLPAGQVRQGRPYHGRHREAPKVVQGPGAGNPGIRAAVDRLHPRRVAPGEGGVDGLLADTRTRRVGVAADDPHQARFVVLGRGGAHLERDALARGPPSSGRHKLRWVALRVSHLKFLRGESRVVLCRYAAHVVQDLPGLDR